MLTEMFHWLYSILILPFISWEMDSENGKRSKQKNVKIFGITCRLLVLFLLQTTTRTYFNTIKKKKTKKVLLNFQHYLLVIRFIPFADDSSGTFLTPPAQSVSYAATLIRKSHLELPRQSAYPGLN